MKRVADLLGKAVEQTEVLRAARAQAVVRQWASIVGEVLATKATPERFERGTLWVAASGSAWAQEIALRKELILDRLNGLADERLFEDLRVGTREPRRDLAAPLDEGSDDLG